MYPLRPSLRAVRAVLRAIPRTTPGKGRITRLALRFCPTSDPVSVTDNFGNTLDCLSLREPIAVALFSSGVYEQDTVDAMLADLPPRGVVLDVGANIGAIALPIAAQRPDARVVCIEADPNVASVLRRNIEQSARSNLVVEQCLAGAEADAGVPFYQAPPGSFGMGSVGPQFHATPVAIPQRALDDVLDDLGIAFVDRVKLDIEGAELGALQGLRRRLAGERPPVVLFEFNDWAEQRIAGQTPGDAQRLLLSLGYRLFALARQGRRGRQLEQPMTEGGAMLFAIPPGG
jgi:FkbM family methyltransferase